MSNNAPLGVLSLCTGIGNLDAAVRRVLLSRGFEAKLTWYAETDKTCMKVLKHYHPDVPNIGDIKHVDDWSVYDADIIVAGFPCQPFSTAGLRKGESDERHLWPIIDQAIRAIRPRYVFLENVQGLLSSGFGTVAADLARNGYELRWISYRASDVGAPHRRNRVFMVARCISDAGGV